MEAFIAKRIKEITGAIGVAFSVYDVENRVLLPRHLELEPGVLKKVIGLLGSKIQKVHSPVDDEIYRKITSSIIGRYESITDFTFGAIPRPVGAILSSIITGAIVLLASMAKIE